MKASTLALALLLPLSACEDSDKAFFDVIENDRVRWDMGGKEREKVCREYRRLTTLDNYSNAFKTGFNKHCGPLL